MPKSSVRSEDTLCNGERSNGHKSFQQKYLELLKLDKEQIQKLNKLRTKAGLEEIKRDTEKSIVM